MVQSETLRGSSSVSENNEYFPLMNCLGLQNKTFHVVLYCIQAEVLALSPEQSWREFGCTEKVAGLQRVAHMIEELEGPGKS